MACSRVNFTFTKIPTSGTSDVRMCEVEETLVVLCTFRVMKFGLVTEFWKIWNFCGMQGSVGVP
jgi:hypothetical protein